MDKEQDEQESVTSISTGTHTVHDKFRLAFPISSNRLSPLSYISVSSSGINVHRIDGTRNHRQTDRERVKLWIGIEILEYWKKRLNRRQKVFNVVLLINLCSPGRECHSERTLAVATLRKAKEAPAFVTANKISRLVYTHTVQRVLAKGLTQIFPSSFSDRTSLDESLSLSSIPHNIGIKSNVTLICETSF